MKKEYFFIFAVALLIFSYVIDSISGPFNLILKAPYGFIDATIISKYPLTAVGILSRSVGIFTITILLFSLVENLFFIKAAASFLLAALFNLFAIQQIATNTRTVTLQWTLSLCFAGLAMLIPSLIYIIKGFIHPIINRPENEKDSTVIND